MFNSPAPKVAESCLYYENDPRRAVQGEYCKLHAFLVFEMKSLLY